MADSAKLTIGDQNIDLKILEGSEGEKALDTRKLRSSTGYITFDEGYGNTGSCMSDISFINGEKAFFGTGVTPSKSWLNIPPFSRFPTWLFTESFLLRTKCPSLEISFTIMRISM